MMQSNRLEPAPRQIADTQFETIASLVEQEAGLSISPSKRAMVFSRVDKLVRAEGLAGFDQYCAMLQEGPSAATIEKLVAALTTNVTEFFREPHHFEHFAETLLPSATSHQPCRVWSAGCADGMEAYSIVMAAAKAGPAAETFRAKVLGTDINRKMIHKARVGIYDARHIQQIPRSDADTFFAPLNGGKQFQIQPQIRDQVTFNSLNLIRDWPMRFKFDAIFCRNVLIYFSNATQNQLWPKLTKALRPGGYLYLGHSERFSDAADHGFQLVGPTTYQRTDSAA